MRVGGGDLPVLARGLHRLVVDLAPEDRLVVGRGRHVEVAPRLLDLLQVVGIELAVGNGLLHLVAQRRLLLVAAEPVLDAHGFSPMPVALYCASFDARFNRSM